MNEPSPLERETWSTAGKGTDESYTLQESHVPQVKQGMWSQ